MCVRSLSFGSVAPASPTVSEALGHSRCQMTSLRSNRSTGPIGSVGSIRHVTKTLAPDQYEIADLKLAEFGRKEIQLAEHEMPGLMAVRREFADAKPLAGA